MRAHLGVDHFGMFAEGALALSEVIAADPERDADGSLSALLGQWRAMDAAVHRSVG